MATDDFSFSSAQSQPPLYEVYRPRSWKDIVGQGKVLQKIRAIARRGLAGRAYWISGQSGSGKTSISRLIAAEIADPLFVEELDASDLTPARLREIERTMSIKAWGKGGRAYLVNESHGLRKDAIRQLLVLLERLPAHAVFLFTSTNDGEVALFENVDDAGPLLSRCIRLNLSRRDLTKPFAQRAREIAEHEGLNGKPMESYLRLMKQCHNNFRMALQMIEAGEMLG